MLSELGVETSVDLDAVLDAGGRIKGLLGLGATSSHALRGGTKSAVLARGEAG